MTPKQRKEIIRDAMVSSGMAQSDATCLVNGAFNGNVRNYMCVLGWAEAWGLYTSPVSLPVRKQSPTFGDVLLYYYGAFFGGIVSQREVICAVLPSLADTIKTVRQHQ